MMRLTRRPKKSKCKEMVSGDLKEGGGGRGSSGIRGVSLSWRNGSSKMIGQTTRTSRTDSVTTLKNQQMVNETELEASDTGESVEDLVVMPTHRRSDDSRLSAALAESSTDPLQEHQLGEDQKSRPEQFYDPDQNDGESNLSPMKHQSIKYLAEPSNFKAPSTPLSKHRETPDRNKSKRLFVPPEEINIDFQAVPPSPIPDPTIPRPGTSLLQPALSDSQVAGRITFDDDFVTMKRQLLDSQRLVRLILGKSLTNSSSRNEIDASLLDTNTILQAIRAFALMKQELAALRKRQEVDDCDPPAILQSLSSPATTSAGLTQRTPSSSISPSQTASTPRDLTGVVCSESWSSISPLSNSVVALWDANKRIDKLQDELNTARNTISALKAEVLSTCNEGNECESLGEVAVLRSMTTEDNRRMQGHINGTAQDYGPIQEESGTTRDDEIMKLKELLRQSQCESDELKYKLSCLTATSTSSCLDVDIKENQTPTKASANSTFNIGKQLSESQQE